MTTTIDTSDDAAGEEIATLAYNRDALRTYAQYLEGMIVGFRNATDPTGEVMGFVEADRFFRELRLASGVLNLMREADLSRIPPSEHARLTSQLDD